MMMQQHGKPSVLVVDDETEIRELLAEGLGLRFNVQTAADGAEAIKIARAHPPDVVLTDIRMPSLDGISLCENLRKDAATHETLIIMLTGLCEVDARVRCFELGADDFISKPFIMREVIARIESRLRRQAETGKRRVIRCGNLTLNLDSMEAKIGDRNVDFSVLELRILRYLVENRDRVVSRNDILMAVWEDTVVSPRTVDTHIASIRKRLVGFDHEITTMYGAGYVLRAPGAPIPDTPR